MIELLVVTLVVQVRSIGLKRLWMMGWVINGWRCDINQAWCIDADVLRC